MDDLHNLYQEVILDHTRNPRNRRELAAATHHAEGYNPLCGDRVTLYLRCDNNHIEDISFIGSGCAISTASVSMLTEVLKGKARDGVKALFAKFHKLVTDGTENPEDDNQLGKLAVFKGVSEFPVRVKCATLAWHTLMAALEKKEEVVKTE